MSFQTPQYSIADLRKWASTGRIQLPDFQRSYKWDDERIRSLLVTILRGHPMGVIMLLKTGGQHVRFKPKPITGVASASEEPTYLLLDGQQRLTSLYQALTGDGVVDTEDDRKKKLRRRYFVDVEAAVGDSSEQSEAIRSVPDSGMVTENFGRNVVLDVSTHELQQHHGLMPITSIFDNTWVPWMLAYLQAGGPDDVSRRTQLMTAFQSQVAGPMQAYEIPSIELDSTTTKEAVATVFEKVNTGGLPLNVFELLTATFAGDRDYFEEHGSDFRLADDWVVTEEVLNRHKVLHDFQRTDFLQAVALLTTLESRKADVAASKPKPAAVSAKREEMLRLQLKDYLKWAPKLRQALEWAAHFLTREHFHSAQYLPYRSQIVGLIAFKVLIGETIDNHGVTEKISQWYWCGVLGELYGSTSETRLARDVEQVPLWATAPADRAGTISPPETISRAGFFESRLLSMKTRNSAAYRGVYALLMSEGCIDWRQDIRMEHATYEQLQVDIHHIFPRAWCEKSGIDPVMRESIVNKTPLGKKTNILLSGDSPAVYIKRLETAGFPPHEVDRIISTHKIDPKYLRAADFDSFFEARREELIQLIEKAMGKPAQRDLAQATPQENPDDFGDQPDDIDSEDVSAWLESLPAS